VGTNISENVTEPDYFERATARQDRKSPASGSSGEETRPVIYRSEMHGLTVTLKRSDQQQPTVELTLGSETRVISFAELTHFCLTLIEAGSKMDTARLECLGVLRPLGKREI
jgi:hypothetical protein